MNLQCTCNDKTCPVCCTHAEMQYEEWTETLLLQCDVLCLNVPEQDFLLSAIPGLIVAFREGIDNHVYESCLQATKDALLDKERREKEKSDAG